MEYSFRESAEGSVEFGEFHAVEEGDGVSWVRDELLSKKPTGSLSLASF